MRTIIPLIFCLLLAAPFSAAAQENVQQSTIYQIDDILRGVNTPAFYSLEGTAGYVNDCEAPCKDAHIMVVDRFDASIAEALRAQSGLHLLTGSVGADAFEEGKRYIFLVQETRHEDGRVVARTITDFKELSADE